MAAMSLTAVPDDPPADPVPVTIEAAVEETIAALKPPKEDTALVALTRKLASVMDGMSGEQSALMIGQTAPQLLKLLQELEARAAKRRAAQRSSRPGKVAVIRAAHAQSPAKRRRSG